MSSVPLWSNFLWLGLIVSFDDAHRDADRRISDPQNHHGNTILGNVDHRHAVGVRVGYVREFPGGEIATPSGKPTLGMVAITWFAERSIAEIVFPVSLVT